jgi:hypothetical protein
MEPNSRVTEGEPSPTLARTRRHLLGGLCKVLMPTLGETANCQSTGTCVLSVALTEVFSFEG